MISHPHPTPMPLAPHANKQLRRSRWSQRKQRCRKSTGIMEVPLGMEMPKAQGSQGFWDEVCQGQVLSCLRVRYEMCRGTRWF